MSENVSLDLLSTLDSTLLKPYDSLNIVVSVGRN